MSGSLSPDSSAGMRIGRYEVLRTIGRGAMGVVYAARHDLTGQVVALKTLHLEQVGESVQAAEQRFMREIQAAVSLHHPGIVRVYEFDRAQVRGLGELIYYAMERIEGQTLHEMIQPGPMSASDAAAICIQVCEALDFAHRNGIVHRDVKPANIFVSNQRRVVLTDFGICKIDNLGTLTAAGAVVGTLPFLAPEQAAEGPLDARADVFSVGAVLYTLITKFYLRSTKATAAIMQAATPGKDVEQIRKMTGFDPALIELLARAVAFQPDDRQPTARALADALRPFAGTIPAPAGAGSQPSPADTMPVRAVTPTVVDPFPAPVDSGDTIPSPPRQAAEAENPFANQALLATLPAREDPFAALGPVTETSETSPEPAPGPRPLPPDPAPLASPPTGSTPIDAPGLNPTPARAPSPTAPTSPRGTARLQVPAVAPRARPSGGKRRARVAALALIEVGVVVIAANALLGLRKVVVGIESLPEGAEVLVDGEPVGATPLTVSIRRGRKQVAIEVFASQREPYRKQLELPLFGGVRPLTVAMPLQRAHLRVGSLPAGARVLVDGLPSCTTPCTVQDLSPLRKHLVVVDRRGCAPRGRVIECEPAERLAWNATLQPLSVSSLTLLQVLSDRQPIVLDQIDRTRAFADGALLVPAGEHLLELGEDRARKQYLVHLVAGTAQRLDLRRRSSPPPQPRLKRKLLHGDHDDSEEVALADEQLDTAGDSPDALVDYGIYLLSQGRSDEASKYFMQALTLAPYNPRGHRGIVAAAIARGDTQLARGQLMSFLNLQTTLHDGELLKQVYGGVQQADRCAAAIAEAKNTN